MITNETRAKIFALYLVCDICYENSTTDDIIVDKLNGVMFDYCIEGEITVSLPMLDAPIQDCQLILTPLSEITDEDAIEVAKMNNLLYRKAISGRNEGIDKQAIAFGKRMAREADFATGDFLRSRGYMLPYMNIDLFEAGIAIKKETV